MSFKIIHLNNAHDMVSCPYCEHIVLDWSQEQYIQPCEHTAFIALDLGFEFVSDIFEDKMKYSVGEIHDQSLNVFEAICSSKIPVTIYDMPLGVENYKRYIGFYND